MAGTRRRNGWAIWLTFAIGLLLSVSPMPQFMEVFRPMWLALLLAFWTLDRAAQGRHDHRVRAGPGRRRAVRHLLGQNALILTLITFLVLSLQQRLRMFPMWQQSLVILVIFGLAQLVQLWLSA
jgi:rod shape-determining protein MreD